MYVSILHITSICHQIIVHKCYLNDRVLTNINICFSPISEAPFDKHDYAKPQKRKILKVEEFDPRSSEFRGLARDNLLKLLSDIDGEQLCNSLLNICTRDRSSNNLVTIEHEVLLNFQIQ